MMAKVLVRCDLPQGLNMRTFQVVNQLGIEYWTCSGSVTIPKGHTEVDADFMKMFMEQNAATEVVKGGHLSIVEEGK